MTHFTVKITDSKEKSFKIRISLPSRERICSLDECITTAGGDRGEWKALDMGFLKVTSGFASKSRRPGYGRSGPTATYNDLELRLPGQDSRSSSFGILLNKFDTAIGTYTHGHGTIVQPWVLAVEPGACTWRFLGEKLDKHSQPTAEQINVS